MDEGNSKKLNTNEETKIDSLMGKLGVNNDDDEINEKEKSSNTKDKRTPRIVVVKPYLFRVTTIRKLCRREKYINESRKGLNENTEYAIN